MERAEWKGELRKYHCRTKEGQGFQKEANSKMATALEVLEDKGGEKTDELVIYEISGGQQEIRRRMK